MQRNRLASLCVLLLAFANLPAITPSAHADNDFYNCTGAGDCYLTLIIDRSGSMNTVRETGNTRCEDSISVAIADVATFIGCNNDVPDKYVAVYLFNSGVTRLTGTEANPFVDPLDALTILNAIDVDGCGGNTALAEAVCIATEAFPVDPQGDDTRIVAISSDGGENASEGPCSGPFTEDLTDPPYDIGSWQRESWEQIVISSAAINVRRFDALTIAPVDEPGGGPAAGDNQAAVFDFLTDMTEVTGGEDLLILDEVPIPERRGACTLPDGLCLDNIDVVTCVTDFNGTYGGDNSVCDTPACPGDLDGDGLVSVMDLLALLSGWGDCPAPCPPCSGDLDANCAVDVQDLLTLLGDWGPCLDG